MLPLQKVKEARWPLWRRNFYKTRGKMKINIKYLNKEDIFELQVVEKKLRSHFILSRAELNKLRTVLEGVLVQSRSSGDKEK